jgi:TetR/AcrR family transcriptional repressor of nem operon
MARKKPAPRTARSRAETKLATREALVDAGLALFAERGLDGPSLDDICERAGFTRGAFYVHFQDRDDLLRAVMHRVGRQVLDALFAPGAASEEGDVAALTLRFVGAFASGEYPLSRAGGVRPFQLLDACARSPAIRREYVGLVTDALERLTRSVRAAQKRSAARDDVPPDDIALLLLSVVVGVQTLLDLELPMEVNDLASSAMRLLDIRAPGPRRRGG